MPVTVVNMIPSTLSGETQRDSEPNLAVNPANRLQIAGSAFTPDPASSGNGPIFVSTDGGLTWGLNVVLPGGNRTGDVTVRFGGTSGVLYSGILRFDNGNLNILRAANYTAAGLMTILLDRAADDQPYVEAATVMGGGAAGQDRVYVPNNDTSQRLTTGRTASVDQSFNAATAGPPAGFGTPARIETRATAALPSGEGNQDGPSVRVAIHPRGRVYGVYFGWRTFGTTTNTTDVVVVRDDNWGMGATPYTAILDGDGLAGVRVATGLTVPSLNTTMGTQRIGSQLAIAADPRDPNIVYIAWCDGSSASTYTVRVRRSTNGGVAGSWSGDLRTVAQATNPGLAIDSRGRVGLLYQQLVNVGGTNRWRTHLVLTDDAFTSAVSDNILADVPDANGTYTGINPIGDYACLLALGKDFYGAFSANNTPSNANFPFGVTYQRFADFATNQLFADAAHTVPVGVSIDPFFFHVTDVQPESDFYVRDWTDSPASGDTGLEPSTHPVFYATSDVWNRRGTLPGSFPNDQPENESAGNGAGNVGDNWAFARVRRNVAGGAGAQTVTAHFLVSKLGTGSSYVDAGSVDPDVSFPDPDPTLTFNPADTGPFITPAYHWHLNAVSSTHLCLAVEISTANDPFVPPSLVGRAPGWPTTDLAVIYDNNKAQRNMGLSTTPARGVGLSESLYAIVHNAATFPRDVELAVDATEEVARRLVGARIEVVGERGQAFKPGSRVVLRGMQPGENRWVGVTITPPAGKAGEVLAVNFAEVVEGQRVNGFGLGARLGTDAEVIAGVLEAHRSVCTRLAAGFDVLDAHVELVRTGELLTGKATAKAYLGRAVAGGAVLAAAARLLAKRGQEGDPFGAARAARSAVAAAAGGDPRAAAVAHLAALEKLDAFLTMLQLAEGDSADILLTVQWQRDLYQRVRRLAGIVGADELVRASDRFVDAYGRREATNADYPEFVQGVRDVLAATAAELRRMRQLVLEGEMARLDEALAEGHVARLQGAHRGVLIRLQSLEGA